MKAKKVEESTDSCSGMVKQSYAKILWHHTALPALVVLCNKWEGVSLVHIALAQPENSLWGGSLYFSWITKGLCVTCMLLLGVAGGLVHCELNKLFWSEGRIKGNNKTGQIFTENEYSYFRGI